MKEKKSRSVPKPIISSTERTGIKGEIFPNFFSWKWLHFWVFLTTIDNTHAYFYLQNLLFCSELGKYNQARKSKSFDLSVRKKRWFFDLLYIHSFIHPEDLFHLHLHEKICEFWDLATDIQQHIILLRNCKYFLSTSFFYLAYSIFIIFILSCSCRIWSLEFCH